MKQRLSFLTKAGQISANVQRIGRAVAAQLGATAFPVSTPTRYAAIKAAPQKSLRKLTLASAIVSGSFKRIANDVYEQIAGDDLGSIWVVADVDGEKWLVAYEDDNQQIVRAVKNASAKRGMQKTAASRKYDVEPMVSVSDSKPFGVRVIDRASGNSWTYNLGALNHAIANHPSLTKAQREYIQSLLTESREGALRTKLRSVGGSSVSAEKIKKTSHFVAFRFDREEDYNFAKAINEFSGRIYPIDEQKTILLSPEDAEVFEQDLKDHTSLPWGAYTVTKFASQGGSATNWMTLLSDVPAGGGWIIDILYDKNGRKIKEIKTHETERTVFTAEYSLDELLEDSSSLADMILDQLEKVDPDAYQTITADIHEEDLREDLTPKDEPTKEEAVRYLMDNIEYERKPSSWYEVKKSIDYDAYKKYLDKLYVVDGSNWWRPFKSHSMPDYVVLVTRPGGLFLVNNEGYDYARYVVRVEGHPKYASRLMNKRGSAETELTLADVSIHGEDGLGLGYEGLVEDLADRYPEATEENIRRLAREISELGKAMYDIAGGDVGDWYLEDGYLGFGVMNWVIEQVKEGGVPEIPKFRFMEYEEGGPESCLVYKYVGLRTKAGSSEAYEGSGSMRQSLDNFIASKEATETGGSVDDFCKESVRTADHTLFASKSKTAAIYTGEWVEIPAGRYDLYKYYIGDKFPEDYSSDYIGEVEIKPGHVGLTGAVVNDNDIEVQLYPMEEGESGSLHIIVDRNILIPIKRKEAKKTAAKEIVDNLRTTDHTLFASKKAGVDDFYDAYGKPKYDYMGISERMPIHYQKAKEFFAAGDWFNAGQHARTYLSFAAEGYGEPEETEEMKNIVNNTRHASKRTATGEADQDYDHELFDAICQQLRAKGFSCKHREFDKYQGVYIDVKGIDTFWIKDYFLTGKIAEPYASMPYSEASLTSPYGEDYSPYRGDYFKWPMDKVLEGFTLRLVDSKTGEVKEIKDPKISDLPEITDVRDVFQLEEGSETEHWILYPEDDPEESIEVTRTGDTVDASMLVDYCEEARRKSFRATESRRVAPGVLARKWETLPKGWTEESAKKFWNSLGGDINKGIEKLKGTGITDPGAFMASLKDLVEGEGWRHEKRKPKKRAELSATGVSERVSTVKKADSRQDGTAWVTKWLAEYDWEYDSDVRTILESEIDPEQKKELIAERIKEIFGEVSDEKEVTINEVDWDSPQIDWKQVDRFVDQYEDDRRDRLEATSSWEPGDVVASKQVGSNRRITIEKVRFNEDDVVGKWMYEVVVWNDGVGEPLTPKYRWLEDARALFDSINTEEDVHNALMTRYAFEGALRPAKTPEGIAEKHDVPVEEVEDAIDAGQKIEMEHTNDPAVAEAISAHHVGEFVEYYDEKKGLPAMEERLETEASLRTKHAYIAYVPGHKNSKGEAAPWVIKSHETGEIVSSHTSEEAAKKHLQQMHAHTA